MTCSSSEQRGVMVIYAGPWLAEIDNVDVTGVVNRVVASALILVNELCVRGDIVVD